ncbi:hypothetical protein [Rhizobium rhizophilum]|uniref:Uncharacterized protein n=1 Tax=Rhizobium rhizophilum TaxID=1850373 RepID=A0ABY2QRZ4_9HYPH|nr:hypothetical protein [Rhizobium rhizophilum]THV12410.1 hypothetical protein E9677_16660 [Rhizobium rhizophilum]
MATKSSSPIASKADAYPETPDGRYFVVKGRLWRKSNPSLIPARREALVKELMAARRALKKPESAERTVVETRQRVDAAKIALGERGPVWWDDGTPDFNRHLVKNTPYADWYCRQIG